MARDLKIRGSYGVDAPWVPALWFGLATAFLAVGMLNLFNSFDAWYVVSIVYFFGGAVIWSIGGSLYLYATFRGKFEVWAEILEQARLKGTEHALDIGCGRGAVTIAVALQLPHGRVTGIDLWRRIDQSGNAIAATEANLKLNGVDDRVTLATANMTSLPFADRSFDLVTASLAIHNVRPTNARRAAVHEAVRVLKPGGMLLIADISKVAEYRATLAELRLTPSVDRPAGWRMWWSGPWMSTRILGVKI